VGAGVVLFRGGVCCAVVSLVCPWSVDWWGVADDDRRRRQVLIRERLKFPSGFSTAVLISVLHGKTREAGAEGINDGGFASLVPADGDRPAPGRGEESRDANSWRRNVQLLLLCFFVSGVFTFATYFFPVLRNLPVFGSLAASTWLWTLNPSLAYVGQGIIMGPATTLHMLIGAVIGWGVLSPLAKHKGWASGSVDDWEHGSKGWIVWISLAIMLADSIVSLGHLALRSCLRYFPAVEGAWLAVVKTALGLGSRQGYTSVRSQDDDDEDGDDEEKSQDDAPPEQQISDRIVGVGLVLSIVFCIACIHIVFGNLVPLYATVTAVLMALVLSIMGVRALGETDLNPVSGISKLAQLFFAFIIPQSNKSSVLINLVAGAVVCIRSTLHSGMHLLTSVAIVRGGTSSLIIRSLERGN
jgi:OPT family oligopeptide transporter